MIAIKLDLNEMKFILEHFYKEKYGAEFKFDGTEAGLSLRIPTYKTEKDENGEVVKDNWGEPKKKLVGFKYKYINLDDFTDLEFFLQEPPVSQREIVPKY